MRLLIQSRSTGRFLVPGEDDQPTWCVNLKLTGPGVLADIENAAQLIEDHCDPEDLAHVIDLDRLGTLNDYT